MSTLQEHLADLRQSHSAVQSERKRREEIMESDAYVALKNQMEALFQGIPDTSEEYEMDKKAVIKMLSEQGIMSLDGFVVKTRQKRSVDVYSVLTAMQGDIDNLMLVATVTQKSLEEFAKANPAYKHDLRKCVKDEGFSIVDVIPA